MTTPDCLERRCGQRFDLHVPVSLKLAGSQHESSGFTQDLSSRGAFVFTDFPLAQGEVVEITLVMPSEITLGESMRVRCQGTVLRVVQPSVGTMLGVAVHFSHYEYLWPSPRPRPPPTRSTGFPRSIPIRKRSGPVRLPIRGASRRSVGARFYCGRLNNVEFPRRMPIFGPFGSFQAAPISLRMFRSWETEMWSFPLGRAYLLCPAIVDA